MASEDTVTDTQMDLLPSFLGPGGWWNECQCVTIGLGSFSGDRVHAERMHALIMKASVGSKRAVEDTVTDGPLCAFFSVLITVASHARCAKWEQRYWIIQDIVLT